MRTHARTHTPQSDRSGRARAPNDRNARQPCAAAMFAGHVTGRRPIGAADGWRVNIIRGTPGRADRCGRRCWQKNTAAASVALARQRNAAINFRKSNPNGFPIRNGNRTVRQRTAVVRRSYRPTIRSKRQNPFRIRRDCHFITVETAVFVIFVRVLSVHRPPPPTVKRLFRIFVTVFLHDFQTSLSACAPKRLVKSNEDGTDARWPTQNYWIISKIYFVIRDNIIL